MVATGWSHRVVRGVIPNRNRRDTERSSQNEAKDHVALVGEIGVDLSRSSRQTIGPTAGRRKGLFFGVTRARSRH